MTWFNKSIHCNNCTNCNKKAPLFKMLSEEEEEILNQNRYEVVFKAGENIIKQGTASSHLIMLTSGIAKLYIEGLDSKNLILELIKPWKLFGGPGIYNDNRYHYSATAIELTSTCFIDSQQIKLLIRKNPDFAEAFIANFSFNSIKTFDRIVSLTQKQMHGRIADVLLYLSKEVYNSPDFEMSLSRQDIGELSGMTKDSAIRILKELENEHVIRLEGKKISIANNDVLEEISLKG
jgi:CRP/FNR family transcriptional regulator, polysaccharide utilization system transcription regulator